MSDRHAPPGLSGDASLRAALAALPLAAPGSSAWPALEAALRAHIAPRPSRRRLPAALAAGIALALLLPQLIATPPAPVDRVILTTPDAGDEIDTLRAQSQQLETWLQRVADSGAPLGGQDLMAAAEIEDLIGLVDMQLGNAGIRPEAAALWRQRIGLLEDLAAVRANPYNFGDTGIASTGTASPPIWIN